MQNRYKWVIFPDGAAGVRRVVLADGREGWIVNTADNELGHAVHEKARDMGFLAVPGSDRALHFVPVPGTGIPFSVSRLAKALNGRVSDLSLNEAKARTVLAKGAVSPYPDIPVEPADVVPVRPEKVAVNVFGETVFRAENGRFVRVVTENSETFVQETAMSPKSRFMRSTSLEDLAPIAAAIYRGASQGISLSKIEEIIRFAMEPRNEEPVDYTLEQAMVAVKTDLVKQLLEEAVADDASRASWQNASRKATNMSSALSDDTRPGESLTPSLHMMMLMRRLTRGYHSADVMGSDDLRLSVGVRDEKSAPLTVLDLSTIGEGQRLSYLLNRHARRADKGRSIVIMPGDPDGDEAMAIRAELGTSYGVESVISLPHIVADGTSGFQGWTMMVFGDKRPEPLPTLPIAALRTMKAVNFDDLLTFEREVRRSTERLREFNMGETDEKKADREEAKANDHQVPYIAMSRVSEPETMIPYALQGATADAQGKVMRHFEDQGGVDAVVASAMGVNMSDLGRIMSAEQVDTVAFWLYSRDQDMKGLACFDGTGVGKTRSNLAIGQAFLRMAAPGGKKNKIFYVTENTVNIPDIVKEMNQMGLGHLKVASLTSKFDAKTEIVDADGKRKTIEVSSLSAKERQQVLESGEFPEDVDLIFTTFSMMNRHADDNPMTQWIRSAFDDSVLAVMDEAHNAINIKSNTGKNIQIIREALPANQFYCTTATPAKKAEEIAAYDYLLPNDVGDKERIIAAVVKGREAGQEAYQTMLAHDASIVRRTRSLSSVNFKAHLPDDEQLTNNQRVMAAFTDLAARMGQESDNIAQRMRQVIRENIANNRLEGHAEEEAIKMANRLNQNAEGFGGPLSQLTNMIMVGLRVQGIYPQIKRDIEAGMKPVVSFEHTMMGLFDEADENADLTNVSLKDQIMRVLDRIYFVTVGGERVDIRDLDPELRRSHQQIAEMINRFPDLPASPIDWLMDQLEKDGVRCGELSGRGIKFSNGEIIKRTKEEKDRRKTVDRFNSGELDALIHNKAGATGLSFHAHKDFLDQRPRSTYIVAAFSEVIKMLQGFGRTDRREQTSNPTINWVMTGLIAETRAFQQINGRLRRLGASVDANRNHPMLIAEVPDLLNKVGDRAFHNVLKNQPDLTARVGVQHLMGDLDNEFTDEAASISFSSIKDLANTCMAKMVMLRDEEQNRLMDSVMMEFEALIEELDARNANPLKPKMIDGEIEITSQVIYEGEERGEHNRDRSAFLDPLYLCTGVLRTEGETFSADTVMKMVERCRRLQGADGLETWANTLRTVMPQVLRRYLPEGMAYNHAVENLDNAGAQFKKRFETLDRMARTMDSIKPGASVRIPMADDLFEVPNSYVITDIIPPKNVMDVGNPSAYKILLAAPGEARERQVGLKRIMDLPETEVVFHIGFSKGDNPPLRKQFDDQAGSVYERPVQILNGNILKAIMTSMDHDLGTPCLYRDATSGQLMKGLVITDRRLNLKSLPVDLRDKGVANVLIDRIRNGTADGEARQRSLMTINGFMSNEKNTYSAKEAPFELKITPTSVIFEYALNKSTYDFFVQRPTLYPALNQGRVLPAKNMVSRRRSSYTSLNFMRQGEEIKAVIDALFTRLEGEDALNLNMFVAGSYRDEIQEILNIQKHVQPVIEAPTQEKQVQAAKPQQPVEVPAQTVAITGDEEEIQWEL